MWRAFTIELLILNGSNIDVMRVVRVGALPTMIQHITN